MLENLLASIEQSVLIDKLAEYTARYTQFLVKGEKRKDPDNWEQIILELQEEIKRRKAIAKMTFSSRRNEK